MTPPTTKAAEIRAGLEEKLRLVDQDRVARGKLLRRVLDMLVNPRDHLDDAGDLVAFGSTNDADTFRDAVQMLENWRWDDIMREGKLPDLVAKCRKANQRATTAESERDSWRRVCERLETEKQAALAERDELLREKERLGDELAAAMDVLRTVHNCGQSAEPDHWKFRCMARDLAKSALENGPAGLADAHSKSPAPSSQSERIAVLEAALRPFAKAAEHDIGSTETDADIFQQMGQYNRAPKITVGDMRRARAALAPLGEE